MTEFLLLSDLPASSQLRNQPLGKLNAQCRNVHSQMWRDVKSWNIGKIDYNTLGVAWLTNNEFRVKNNGVEHPDCHYLAMSGTVCNKCGKSV